MAKRFSALPAGVLACVLAGVALAGCAAPTAGVAGEAEAAVGATSDSESTPTATPAASSTCVFPGGDGMIVNDEPLNVELYANMHDYGAREGANGTVEYASDGTLASYVVASGDFTDAILDRLCVGFYSLEALNAVRRGSVHSVDPTHQAYLADLYIGDTLNLSPYTITSVGDINGEVYAYETVYGLPPQR